MFERFTDRSRKVMALANRAAHELDSPVIEASHVLLAMVREGSGVGANVLTSMGIDLKSLEAFMLANRPSRTVSGVGEKLQSTPAVKSVVKVAIDEARVLNHNYVGTEHLLLGLLRSDDPRVSEILHLHGVELEPARQSVLQLLGSGKTEGQPPTTLPPTAPPRDLGRLVAVRWWITDVLRNPGKSLSRWQRLKLRLARWLLS